MRDTLRNMNAEATKKPTMVTKPRTVTVTDTRGNGDNWQPTIRFLVLASDFDVEALGNGFGYNCTLNLIIVWRCNSTFARRAETTANSKSAMTWCAGLERHRIQADGLNSRATACVSSTQSPRSST